MAPDTELGEFLSSVIGLCARRAVDSCAAAGLIGEISENARMAPAKPETPIPRDLPVCRHLAEALSLAKDGPAADLAEAIAALAGKLCWVQNPNYVHDSKLRAFVADYAYVKIAGPDGMVLSPDTALGLLLIGPKNHYPAHSHPAEEIYMVVAGEAEWQRGGAPWQLQPPGSVIHHEPKVIHAMRTAAQPLLALYAWRGEISTAARLV
jgi:mannose-6-phosphate isomerase-like protein (cupin superfamily)